MASVFPPNLSSGFGGADATYAAFSLEAFRPGLFDLDISDPSKITSLIAAKADGTSATYTVPNYLNLTWASYSDYQRVSGNTKTEYVRNLSKSVNLGFSIFGFGEEFKRTFNENSKEETFKKYLAQYDKEIIYKVGFKNPASAKNHLSPDAKAAFKSMDAAQIVDTYGTHYMTDVSFGGLRIYSFTLDTRDTFTESDMSDAIDAKMPIIDPDTGTPIGDVSGGAGNKDRNSTRIARAMESNRVRTLGGIAPDGLKLVEWRKTLIQNPVAVWYSVKPIYELLDATDPKKAALTAEVQRRLAENQPSDSSSLLAMRVPLKTYFSDRNSRGKHDMTVAYPDAPQGWLRAGQFAQGTKWADSNMERSYGIAVRVNPNMTLNGLAASPAVLPATSCQIKWSTRQNSTDFGMFTPICDTKYSADLLMLNEADRTVRQSKNYYPLGDIFEPTRSSDAVRTLDSVACFSEDMLKPATSGDKQVWIWDDYKTGGTPDITVVGAHTELGEKFPPKDRQMVVLGDGGSPAYIFQVVARKTDGSKVAWKILDFKKVKWVENKFLANLK